MGRPEMQEAERRSVYIMVRLTNEEKEAVKKAAKAVMRSPSDFARWAILAQAKNFLQK